MLHETRPPVAQRSRWAFSFLSSISFLLLLAIATAIYWPGLAGPFLFDDFANLDALGKYGGVRDLETLRLYVLGGHSGPTGRPIALLSFLLDGTTWPTDPWPFKRTDLLLHLLNGFLLFLLSRQLLSVLGKLTDNRVIAVALLAAGAWLLHPFLVSTVLYPVQRMAILSTLFVLLGLWGYAHGRLMLARYPFRAYLWMSSSLIICTLLAVLSKENGVLLPLLAVILEITVFTAVNDTARPDWRWSSVFLWLPAVLPVAYLLYMAVDGSLAAGFVRRSFDITERLLTETRILFDYLGWWFYPRVHSPGLLMNGYPVSRSLLDPPSTLLAVAGIAGLVSAAIYLRKRYPLFSLGVLFYFAAHWLESGPLSLELYFEHRNYLPAVFLFLPVMTVLGRSGIRYRSVSLIGPAILIALALLTYQRASIWGNEERLAYSWASHHPDSQRAQRYAALVAEQAGKPELAIAILQDARKRAPGNVMFNLHALTLQCRYHHVPRSEVEAFIKLLRKPYKFRTFEAWHNFVELAPTPECRGLDHDDVLDILVALRDNPLTKEHRGPKQRILHLIGLLETNSGNRANAYHAFMAAQNIKPDIERALLGSSLLATKGYYPEALSLLDHAEQVFNKRDKSNWLDGRGNLDYDLEIKLLKSQIHADMTEDRPGENH